MARKPKQIQQYTLTLKRWRTLCEECGAEIDRGYATRTQARLAWERMRDHEGRALCDKHWIDPDEEPT